MGTSTSTDHTFHQPCEPPGTGHTKRVDGKAGPLVGCSKMASTACAGALISILGVHSSGHQCRLLAGGLIPNHPFQGSEDDLGQLSMPVGAKVPSALNTWNGSGADPLQSTTSY